MVYRMEQKNLHVLDLTVDFNGFKAENKVMGAESWRKIYILLLDISCFFLCWFFPVAPAHPHQLLLSKAICNNPSFQERKE